MPGAPFPVLTTIQPIVGVDMHKAIPPPPPAPPPFTPHVVVWGVGLSQKMPFLWATGTSTASTIESGVPKFVAVGVGHAVGRTHDAGPHPAHVWPNVLLPIIMLGSASKSEFGSGTVKVSTSKGAMDMGVNVAWVMNLNLQCNDFPIPKTPTGMAFTLNYTVYAGFSLADFFRGLIQMIVDILISLAVGAICAVLSGAVKGLISRVAGSSAWGALGKGILGSFKRPQSAAALMNDGAGVIRSSGRLFVDAWRAMLPAAKNAWKNDAVGLSVGVGNKVLKTFGFGSAGGWGLGAQNAVAKPASGAVDNLFR